MKENEIDYLHKEISCLRNELQFLNMVRCLHLCVFWSANMGNCSVKLIFLGEYHGMFILVLFNPGNVRQKLSNDFPTVQCFKHACHSLTCRRNVWPVNDMRRSTRSWAGWESGASERSRTWSSTWTWPWLPCRRGGSWATAWTTETAQLFFILPCFYLSLMRLDRAETEDTTAGLEQLWLHGDHKSALVLHYPVLKQLKLAISWVAAIHWAAYDFENCTFGRCH